MNVRRDTDDARRACAVRLMKEECVIADENKTTDEEIREFERSTGTEPDLRTLLAAVVEAQAHLIRSGNAVEIDELAANKGYRTNQQIAESPHVMLTQIQHVSMTSSHHTSIGQGHRPAQNLATVNRRVGR